MFTCVCVYKWSQTRCTYWRILHLISFPLALLDSASIWCWAWKSITQYPEVTTARVCIDVFSIYTVIQAMNEFTAGLFLWDAQWKNVRIYFVTKSEIVFRVLFVLRSSALSRRNLPSLLFNDTECTWDCTVRDLGFQQQICSQDSSHLDCFSSSIRKQFPTFWKFVNEQRPRDTTNKTLILRLYSCIVII